MRRALVASNDLRSFLRHLPPKLKRKIKFGLEEILADPSKGKPLREELAGLHSYWVGNVRIVYRTDEKAVALITIGPRKTVYQKAALELKAQQKSVSKVH